MPPGSAKKHHKRKSPRCRTCERAIRIPEGWTAGSAIRRHYWAKHREVMQPERGAGR